MRNRRSYWYYLGLSLILSLLSTLPAFAWGDQGHQLTAAIAARNLTSGARLKIATIIRAVPKPQDDLKLKALVGTSGTPSAAQIEKVLVKIAIWPDHMPGGKKETEPWHFIDVGLFEGATASNIDTRCPAPDNLCVVKKIPEMVQRIKAGDSTPRPSGAAFAPDKELRFLVHFLGDIHQPLHCATDADAGGNCVKTINLTNELHAVWDTPLVGLATKGSTDPAGAIIAALDSRKAEFQAELDPVKIAADSFDHAKNDVYGKATPAIPVIDHFVDLRPKECPTKAPEEIKALRIDARGSYNHKETLDIVRQQLFKGGVRLAAILNGL